MASVASMRCRSVSIHAPARGATLSLYATHLFSGFNPRTRTGCDLHQNASSAIDAVSIHAPARGATSLREAIATICKVSIHAPARGATHNRFRRAPSCKFQSTHPHGVRLGFATVFVIVNVFQSTHPHGVRPPTACKKRGLNRFNPRTRTGCDSLQEISDLKQREVSIHAPARGATWLSRMRDD